MVGITVIIQIWFFRNILNHLVSNCSYSGTLSADYNRRFYSIKNFSGVESLALKKLIVPNSKRISFRKIQEVHTRFKHRQIY